MKEVYAAIAEVVSVEYKMIPALSLIGSIRPFKTGTQ